MEAPRQANDSGEYQPSGSSPECNAGSASSMQRNDSEARHEVGAASLHTLTSTTNPHPGAGPSDEPLPAPTSTDNPKGPLPSSGRYGQGEDNLASAPGADGCEGEGVTTVVAGPTLTQDAGAMVRHSTPAVSPLEPERLATEKLFGPETGVPMPGGRLNSKGSVARSVSRGEADLGGPEQASGKRGAPAAGRWADLTPEDMAQASMGATPPSVSEAIGNFEAMGLAQAGASPVTGASLHPPSGGQERQAEDDAARGAVSGSPGRDMYDPNAPSVAPSAVTPLTSDSGDGESGPRFAEEVTW